jgi:hypothetical protein
MSDALSDETTDLSFTISAGASQRSHFLFWVPWDSRPYFTVSYLRPLFVASYDSQGYGGGIRPRLHTGDCFSFGILLTYIDAARTRITENTCHMFAIHPVHWRAGWTYRKHPSIVAFTSVAGCLPSRCLAIHVTVFTGFVSQLTAHN